MGIDTVARVLIFKDLKDNKEDSLFEILKKMNKEFMN